MKAMRSVLTVTVLLALPSWAAAQGTFTSSCAAAPGNSSVRQYCERVGQAVDILQPRLGISLTGGNPVPGTMSTLGMRLGTVPRVTLAFRATAAAVDVPAIERINADDDLKFPLPSVHADASIGVFQGFSIAPTIGGFGSVDLLGSAGTIPLPEGEGFTEDRPMTWAVGARVGLLRESFTAPGVSVSGMYRKLGTLSYGDSVSGGRDAYFALDDFSVMSFRAGISKRIPLIGIGAAAGVGYDKYDASAMIRVSDPDLLGGSTIRLSADDMKTDRKSAFANLSWTLLILSVVGEVGYQEGGEAVPAATIPTDKLEKKGLFGSVALRFAL